ncbi:MAG: hypothetical protein WC356_00940 [Candidatus Micrarchaeia archaeon]|jgi:hypothetical protein
MLPLIYLIDIPFITVNDKKKEKCDEEITDLEEEIKGIKQKNILYSIIIDKYRDLIEEQEEKSISALKYLINPEDKFVRLKIEEIKSKLENYSNELAITEAINYIKTIETIRWPVSFWLSFIDINKYKLGDDMDKCLLLCSLLKALEIDSKILVDENKHPYIMYLLNNINYLVECDEGIINTGSEKEIFDSKTFIYAFNDNEYIDMDKNED